ncbi:MAG: hypothetical protein ACI835_003583 [Planctomycetota bacterium]|jgi:hypothetical protein
MTSPSSRSSSVSLITSSTSASSVDDVAGDPGIASVPASSPADADLGGGVRITSARDVLTSASLEGTSLPNRCMTTSVAPRGSMQAAMVMRFEFTDCLVCSSAGVTATDWVRCLTLGKRTMWSGSPCRSFAAVPYGTTAPRYSPSPDPCASLSLPQTTLSRLRLAPRSLGRLHQLVPYFVPENARQGEPRRIVS